MIYHLARKYDEWPGEDYDGSSCRGAMKGWFHHGVCSESCGPTATKRATPGSSRRDPKWAADAAQTARSAPTTGSIEGLDRRHAGGDRRGRRRLLSSDVHGGWDRIDRTKYCVRPTIPWKTRTAKRDGGHAFALVGYDAQGFVVQNSWGESWAITASPGSRTRTGWRTGRRLGRGHGSAH